MTWPLRQGWFWRLFLVLLAVMILPLLLVGLILSFSPAALFALLIVVLVLWIIVRSYRDVREREREEDTSP